MIVIKIPESELMAEKLGMINLCKNCGQRLIRKSIARIPVWHHEATNSLYCPDEFQIFNKLNDPVKHAEPLTPKFGIEY